MISPNDSNIVYSPYNWSVTGSTAQTVQSGAYLRTTLQGSPTSVAATFDLTGVDGSAKLAIRVDGGAEAVVDRAASVAIAIPSNGWTKHIIEITVVQVIGNDLWNTPTTAVKFTGFTTMPSSVTTTTTRRRSLNVACFGDSITNGYAAASTSIIDGRLNWAYPLRNILGAEVGVIGNNSQGFSHVGDANIPVFGSSYNYLWSGTSRSFTIPAQPDFVFIHMGTNDGGANNTTAMTATLNGILAATTLTKIIVIQQWTGTGQRTFWQNAIAASSAPARVTYLDTTGWWSTSDAGDGLHPWGYINLADLSPRIASSIQSQLVAAGAIATPTRFLNKSGVAIPIS